MPASCIDSAHLITELFSEKYLQLQSVFLCCFCCGSAVCSERMKEILAPVKCVVREKDPYIDVKIIRKDRSILYKVEPRRVQTVHNEVKRWKCAPSEVRRLITSVLGANDSQQNLKQV